MWFAAQHLIDSSARKLEAQILTMITKLSKLTARKMGPWIINDVYIKLFQDEFITETDLNVY